MKMVWIVCNESISAEVMEILDGGGVLRYTVWQNVLGKDDHEGKTHWGNDVFPGRNWAFMILCGDADLCGLKEKFKTLADSPYVRRAGLQIFQNDAEEII